MEVLKAVLAEVVKDCKMMGAISLFVLATAEWRGLTMRDTLPMEMVCFYAGAALRPVVLSIDQRSITKLKRSELTYLGMIIETINNNTSAR